MRRAVFHFKPGYDAWWKSADGSCIVGTDANVVIIVAIKRRGRRLRQGGIP